MRARALLAVTAALIMIPVGGAVAAPLHGAHVGTSVTCDGPVLWHFVQNQVTKGDTTAGEITAEFDDAGVVVRSATKVLTSARHYDVVTDSSDTLLSASTTIAAGKVVLSHTECLPEVPTEVCVTGETVTITWPGVELGYPSTTGLVERSARTTSILPGTYDVTLTSTDTVHAPGVQPDQDQEQWYVVLTLGGTTVDSSGVIADLPTAQTTLAQGVGTVTLPDGADGAVATHLLAGQNFTAWGSPESVEPTSAVLTCI